MKITIAITTFNRREHLLTIKKSLEYVVNISNHSIRIYDDCSTDYGYDYLKSIFSTAVEVRRRNANMGADANMRQTFIDFLESTDDVLFMLDSDLLCHPLCIEMAERLLDKTDGILSLYNSTYHKAYGRITIDGEECLVKKTVGAAGLLMKRSIVQRIIANCPQSRTYDWDLSNYLSRNGIRLIVTEKSYVQHIGLHGTNTGSSSATDFGLNFYLNDTQNEKILVDFFQDLILRKDKIIAELPAVIGKNIEADLERGLEYKIIRALVTPARKFKRFLERLAK